MSGQDTTRSLTMNFAKEMRTFMDKQDERQEQMLQRFGEIQVQLERQGQLSIRMDYMERNLDEVKKRLESVECDIAQLRKDLATLTARFGEISAQLKERARIQEKEADIAYSERRDMRHQVADLIVRWGPWAGILGLLGKELLE